MKELVLYKRMPNWTADTLPAAVRRQHNTKPGTWAHLQIVKGSLAFYELTEQGEVTAKHIFTADSEIPFVKPGAWHRVEPLTDDLECYLEFHCQLKDYFPKRYGLGAVHSEVVEVAEHLDFEKVLDLGCGSGRNSLYLAKAGASVTAVDKNELALAQLSELASQENVELDIQTYNIEEAALTDMYDLIVSTVVFMFLNPESIPDVLYNMQESTKIGGYNLIVCAMDTTSHPCSVSFPFTFKEGELKAYYQDWELIKYNENLGHLHKRDENGNPIELQFATLLARKVR
ncbi:SAM-dependent methyltransferase TehB [Streptococcus himalayensis]|uniref:Tellurite resistance methyltransferase TehB n=1 Tax=Streptococcus himalayensis TaxID=1888195 RepID=A0A917EFS9_9STRE|nr:SAM-dependent methyltransferase TehB [Streptococcus himalayensis]GGE29756.1 tellurite resistance methyltransferase TehB [Streptococcus himalayensis]